MLNQMFQGIGAASRGGQDSPLMDTLAAMSLQDLQKYAQAHKNDAATVALISSIANIKKKAIASEQTQPVNPQQPKIGEQVIAGIAPQPAPQAAPQQALPEDQGIAQLPADNLKGMAGGGIVAFEAGGQVPRFQNQGLVGSTPRLSGESFQDYRRRVFEAELQTQRDRNNANVTARETERQRLLAQRPDGLLPPSPFFDRKPLPASSAMQAAGVTAGPAPTVVNQETLQSGTDIGGPGSSPANMGAPQGPAAPPVPLQGPPAPPQGPAAPTAPKVVAPLPGAPSVNAYADQVMGIDKLLPKKEEAPVEETFMKKREGISKAVYEKAEGMVNKEKDRLSEGKEQDFYMALIEGGLAAAAGDSPNGIQNLAKGFSQGAKSYSSALKDFRKASQENSKMELDIERAKAAEKRGDMDAYQKYDDSIKNRNADIDKLRTSGLFSLQNVHTSGQYQQQAAATSAAATLKAASMPGATERLYETLGGGGPGSAVKGARLLAEIQAGKRTVAQAYEDYMKAWAGKDTTVGQPLTPVQYADQIKQINAAMSPPPGPQDKPAGNVLP
jgi:hypothetical protein